MPAVRNEQSEIIRGGALCHRCRYPIRGLPREGRCPECGEEVAGSAYWLRPTPPQIAFQIVAGLVTLRFGVILLAAFPAALAFALVALQIVSGLVQELIIMLVMNAGAGASAVGAMLFILGVVLCTPPVPWGESNVWLTRTRRAARLSAAIFGVGVLTIPLILPTLVNGHWSRLPHISVVLASAVALAALTPIWLGNLARVVTRRRKSRAWMLAVVLAPICVLEGFVCLYQNDRTVGAILFLVLAVPTLVSIYRATACVRYYRRIRASP